MILEKQMIKLIYKNFPVINIQLDSMKRASLNEQNRYFIDAPPNHHPNKPNSAFLEKANTMPLDSQKAQKNIKNCFQAQRKKMIDNRPSSYKAFECPAFMNSPTTPQRYTHCFNSESQPSNVGMMNPLYINIRSNPRKMYSSHVANPNLQKKNRKENGCQSAKTSMKTKKNDPVYDNIINEMNDYFQMMKLSTYKNNITKYKKPNEREIQIERLKKVPRHHQWTDNHLNVVGLKPNPFRGSGQRMSIGEKLITEEIEKNLDGNIVKYHSSFMNTDMMKDKNQRNDDQMDEIKEQKKSSKSSHHFIRKNSSTKVNIVVDYFGKVKDGMSFEEVNKIKIFYYKDLIWKCWFNRDWKVKNNEGEIPKFFVGRGNNSRLIKSIMNKRWWWKMETKEENANFIWTQLKIYTIYQSQQQNSRVDAFENQVESWRKNRTVSLDANVLILSEEKYKKWRQYLIKYGKKESKTSEKFQTRKAIEGEIKKVYKIPQKVTNHLEFSRVIGNKKALYKTMMIYYDLMALQSKFLPNTYHIMSGLEDDQYLRFLSEYYRKAKIDKNSMWIVKPGQMSNRGNGIKVCQDLQDIKNAIKTKKNHANGKSQSYIIQEYIYNPFLYCGRKFDIRHFIMVTSNFGRIQGYVYQEGYIRTASYKYNMKNQNSLVHLTNDALQKKCKEYGKYEKGNKISYEEFEKYLSTTSKGKHSFYRDILPKIKQISVDIMNAAYYLLDPKRRSHNFQIFGIDIMIDEKFKPWLLQVNTNPCLELSSPLSAKIIPKMLDNAFTITLDPLFPPPQMSSSGRKAALPDNYMAENKFQLIFDEKVKGEILNTMYDDKKLFNEMEGFGSDEQAYQSEEDDYDY